MFEACGHSMVGPERWLAQRVGPLPRPEIQGWGHFLRCLLLRAGCHQPKYTPASFKVVADGSNRFGGRTQTLEWIEQTKFCSQETLFSSFFLIWHTENPCIFVLHLGEIMLHPALTTRWAH
jgi:hypothetical protein